MEVFFDFGGFFRRFVKFIWIPAILAVAAVITLGVLDRIYDSPSFLASSDIMLSLEELNGGLPLNQTPSMPSSVVTEEEEGMLEFLFPESSSNDSSSAPTLIKGNNIDVGWVRTCGLVFGSQNVLSSALKEAGLDISYKEAVNSLRISYPQDTVIRIGFVNSDPDMSVKMVEYLTKYGIEAVEKLIDLPKVNCTVIAKAEWANLQGQNLPSYKYRSPILTWMMILYIVVIAVVTLVDPRIQSYSMAENVLGIRFLGGIRNARKEEDLQVLSIALQKQTAGARTVLFCTAKEDDGCSKLLADLAAQLNVQGKKTLVVDAKTNQDNPLDKLGEYDLILIDSPPVNESPSVAAVLSGVCDQTVFVVQYKKTSINQAANAVHLLENTGAKFAGLICTNVQRNLLYRAEFPRQCRPAAK